MHAGFSSGYKSRVVLIFDQVTYSSIKMGFTLALSMHQLFSFENRVAEHHVKQVWGELCMHVKIVEQSTVEGALYIV